MNVKNNFNIKFLLLSCIAIVLYCIFFLDKEPTVYKYKDTINNYLIKSGCNANYFMEENLALDIVKNIYDFDNIGYDRNDVVLSRDTSFENESVFSFGLGGSLGGYAAVCYDKEGYIETMKFYRLLSHELHDEMTNFYVKTHQSSSKNLDNERAMIEYYSDKISLSLSENDDIFIGSNTYIENKSSIIKISNKNYDISRIRRVGAE